MRRGATIWWWGVSLPVWLEVSTEIGSHIGAFNRNIFEVCVWVWACGLGSNTVFLFFFLEKILWLTGIQCFPTFLWFFLARLAPCTVAAFPLQPAMNNIIALQCLTVTSCIWYCARKLIFGRWPSQVKYDTLLVWAERQKPSLCLQNTWC